VNEADFFFKEVLAPLLGMHAYKNKYLPKEKQPNLKNWLKKRLNKKKKKNDPLQKKGKK
jgi:hypothetical protein